MNRQDYVGWLAVSRAGHDRDEVFVIVREEKEYIWLADGGSRSVSKPKKKKKKHVQLIKCFSDDALSEGLRNEEEYIDSEIRRVLKAYRKSLQERE